MILSTLITRAKAAVNMEGDPFIPDTEWTSWINEGIRELRERMIDHEPELFALDQDVTITSGNSVQLVVIPDRVLGVDYEPGTDRELSLPVFRFSSRHDVDRMSYCIVADPSAGETGAPRLMVKPDEMAVGTYRVYYVPMFNALEFSNDSMPPPLVPWSEFVVIWAAIAASVKNEDNPAPLERMLERITARIFRRDGRFNSMEAPTIGRRSMHYEDRLRRTW